MRSISGSRAVRHRLQSPAIVLGGALVVACGNTQLDAFAAATSGGQNNTGTPNTNDGDNPIDVDPTDLVPDTPPDALFRPLGNWSRCVEAIALSVADHALRVDVCGRDVIRVRYAPGTSLPDTTSLIVVPGTAAAAEFKTDETADHFGLTTDAVRVVVDKSNGSVEFTEPDGTRILREASSNGKVLEARVIDGVDTYRAHTRFALDDEEALYGLGEFPSNNVNHRGRDLSLVQTPRNIPIPLLVSSRGWGVLWDSTARLEFTSDGSSAEMAADSAAAIDYYFLYGPDLDSVIGSFRKITGNAPLLPKWGYGYIHSENTYESSGEFIDVKDGFRESGFPIDVVTQDIHYWDPEPWGSHSMNPERYPDPAQLVSDLHADNLRLVITVWPVFHEGSANYDEHLAAGTLLPANENPYNAFDPQGRQLFWQQVQTELMNYGMDGLWLESSAPWPHPTESFETGEGRWMDVVNAYSLEHARSVYEGQRSATSDRRVFTLTRSAYAGSQRYSAVARAGDTQSEFSQLPLEIPAGVNFSLAGMPYWATDIGGYYGADWTQTSNRELYVRWFQLGAFCPIFRTHGEGERMQYLDDLWGADAQAALFTVDQLRYRLMPYIYSNAWSVTHQGYTIMRHPVMDFQNDPQVYDINDQFMFGSALLVSPIVTAGATSRSVYLPEATWYDFWTGEMFAGGGNVMTDAPLDRIPIHVRAGSIVPMGPMIQYATEAVDPVELRVYPGADGAFVLYEDTGDGYQYENGAYAVIPILWNDADSKLTIGARVGSFPGMLYQRTFNVSLVSEGHGVGLAPEANPSTVIRYDGSPVARELSR